MLKAIGILLLVTTTLAQAQETTPIQIAVWPQLAPGETTASPGKVGDTSGNVIRLTDVTAAQLFIYPLPGDKTGPAVMVCPGGGYSILATDLEGSEIAHWLNRLGYVAVVLHYRVPNNRDGALQDGQRALSLLRERAQEFRIDPTHLGIMGFSAGGHLCAKLAVDGTKRTYPPIDKVDEQSCRPDLALLIYPAFLVIQKGSTTVSPEVAPVAGMPPMFLAQSKDDSFFDIEPYAAALTGVGIPVQNCVYEKGGHGYGLRLKSDIPASQWSKDAADWLQRYFPTHSQ